MHVYVCGVLIDMVRQYQIADAGLIADQSNPPGIW